MRDMKRIEEFQKAIVGVKFTPAQKKIVELILKGWTIEIVNKHHMSGGQLMWKKPNSDYLEHAGKVYKAFFNVFYQIKKQSGVVLSPNGYIN